MTITEARRDLADAWLAQQPTDGDAGAGRHVLNPATGQPLAWVDYSGPAAVSDAVEAARRAFDDGPWPQLGRKARAAVLHQIAETIRANAAELATLLTLENGKLYRESLIDDLPETADIFDYYAGWTDKLYGESSPVDSPVLNLTVREPVGVCALVVPWNFPLLLAAWKLAPALAMGNTVVLKPSEYTPFSTLRMVELIQQAVDLPPGVLQVVVGDGATGQSLVSHAAVSKVSFTGSTPVGRQILASVAHSNLATVTLELGGNAPNIVFADVPDLEAVIERQFNALFSQKGEKCTEPARVIVERAVHEQVVEGLARRAEAVVCGDPFDPLSGQGPQCTQAQFDKIQSLIEMGVAQGAQVVAGGGADPLSAESGGWYIRPTVLDGVTQENEINGREVFGPVAKVSVFDTEDEAVALANGTDFGLAAGVNSGDVSRARRVANRLDAGQVFVNHYGQYDFAAPFGGFKGSGWGKEMGPHALESYTRLKSIWLNI